MATIINNPGTTSSEDSSGIGFFVGLVFLAFIVILLLVYGLPVLRNRTTGVTPSTNNSGQEQGTKSNETTPNANQYQFDASGSVTTPETNKPAGATTP